MRIVTSAKANRLAQRDNAVEALANIHAPLQSVERRVQLLEKWVTWLALPWWRRLLVPRPGRKG